MPCSAGEQDEATGEWSYRLIIGDEADGARYPFGLGADRSGAANLIVHDGYLYIGGYNDPMIALPGVLQMDFEELYKDLDSPVCLWRMDANENIDLVAGEANQLFPEVKGNLGAGLGSNLNQYVWRMESYNGKLYVGTFDIGSLAYPLMQVTNGDILKRSPEEWKTQFEYIIKLLELLKSSGSLAARSATGISSMSATLTSMTSLLNQGGIEDLASTEAFYSLLKKVVSLYENLRKYLPDSITEKLDGIFNQDTVDNFYYFIGVCKYLSKGERGFDLLVSGDGINFEIARNICYKLDEIGISANAYNSIQWNHCKRLQQDKIPSFSILLSHTGKNPSMVDAAKRLKQYNIPSLSITGNVDKRLLNLTDYNFQIMITENTFEFSTVIFTMSSLYILDILVASLIVHNYDKIERHLEELIGQRYDWQND